MSDGLQERSLKILTNPFGASIILTIIILVAYVVSVDVIKIPNFVRFILITLMTTMLIFYSHNYYILKSFKEEPIIKGTYDDFAKPLVEPIGPVGPVESLNDIAPNES